MRLIMIDNYDSFTYNLAQLLFEFNLEVLVYRHDQVTLKEIEGMKPDWLCISPGPRDPAHAGISKAVVECFGADIPILGVCLGMQVINEVFGGKTCRAPVPMHGKCSLVHHCGTEIFDGIPSPFRAARYHSLCIEPGSEFIIPLAVSDDRVIMGIRHKLWPVYGVQFHPESFMSEYGIELLANFLSLNPRFNAPSFSFSHSSDRFPRANVRNVEYEIREGNWEEWRVEMGEDHERCHA